MILPPPSRIASDGAGNFLNNRVRMFFSSTISESSVASAPSGSAGWPPFRVVVCCYLGLTGLYFFLGYMGDWGGRLAPVDSAYYYMYLRSLFFDGNLDFSNEVGRLFGEAYVRQTAIPATGLPGNNWSVGPAIFWLPFFLLAHGATLLADCLGARLAADGYSVLYSAFIWVGNSLYCLLGFWFVARNVERFARPPAAYVACLSLLFVTPLTYYIWPLTAMAHNTAFLMAAAYTYFLLKKGVDYRTVLCGGVLFLCRWQAVIYLLPLFALALLEIWRTVRERPGGLPRLAMRYALLSLLLLLAMSPQMLAWKYLYDSFIVIPHGRGFIHLSQLNIWPVLFSLQKGVFSWHPALLFGVAGLILLCRKEPFWGPAFLAAVVLQLLLISSLECWWAGWSFGQRFMIEALPFLAVGLAVLYGRLSSGWRYVLLSCLLLLAFWNQLFLYQYQYGLVPRAQGMTTRQFFADKFYIPTRARAKRLLRKALRMKRAGDLGAYRHYALQARALNPFEERMAMAAGLACVLSEDRTEGIPLFRFLLSLHPDDPLYIQTFALLQEKRRPDADLLEKLHERLTKLLNA